MISNLNCTLTPKAYKLASGDFQDEVPNMRGPTSFTCREAIYLLLMTSNRSLFTSSSLFTYYA